MSKSGIDDNSVSLVILSVMLECFTDSKYSKSLGTWIRKSDIVRSMLHSVTESAEK